MNTTKRLKNHRWSAPLRLVAIVLAPILVAAGPPAHTNRLAGEKSPYLLEHAHNPVDWYPWGKEALARAKAENKPIFLSIGYATCHWCHVMERESFENEEIAALLNRWFVCIKVDREERPDLDAIYMNAVQAMNGSGGWPLNVFLTPDLQPFFGGTYFPPETRGGQIGLRDLLPKLHELWVSNPERPRQAAAQLTDQLRKASATQPGETLPDRSVFDRYVAETRAAFDKEDAGFGSGAKFPTPMDLSLWMRIQWRKGHPGSRKKTGIRSDGPRPVSQKERRNSQKKLHTTE